MEQKLAIAPRVFSVGAFSKECYNVKGHIRVQIKMWIQTATTVIESVT